MSINSPKDGASGTTEQSPRWEGPQSSKPRGYMHAKDDPHTKKDANGETIQDPQLNKVTDGLKTKGDK